MQIPSGEESPDDFKERKKKKKKKKGMGQLWDSLGGGDGDPRRTDFNASTVADRREEIAQSLLGYLIEGNANPKNIGGLGNFLKSLGMSKFKDDNPAGDIAHNWKVWTGALPDEGYGMVDREGLGSIPQALWEYVFEPQRDRTMRNVKAGHLEDDPDSNYYFNRDPGGDINNPLWYDIYGRKVNAPYEGAIKFPKHPGDVVPGTTPTVTPGWNNTTPGVPSTLPKPQVNKPNVTPAFYGSKSPTPYGLGYNNKPMQKPKPPAWYSTWRY